MRYLLDETPVFCNRTLAKELGLHEALVLQQVNYWIEINKKAGRNFYDGHYWTYNSLKAWQENDFSYMSFDMVRKTFSGLEKSGYLLVGYYNRDGRDRTKWYTINEERLEALFREVEEKKKIAAQEALKNAANIDMPPENIGDCNMQSVENTPFVQNTLQIDRNITNVEKSNSQNIANTTFVKSTNARLENPKCNIAKMQNATSQNAILYSNRDFLQRFHTDIPPSLPPVTVTQSDCYGKTGREDGRKIQKPTKPFEICLQELKAQVEYDYYAQSKRKSDFDDILPILADVMTYPDNATVVVNQMPIPASLVKERYRQLNGLDIEYLADCIYTSDKKIQNIRSFILTCAYNAKNTEDAYYTNFANYDLRNRERR